MTGLKLLKNQSQNAATNHAWLNIQFTMAACFGNGGALSHLNVSDENSHVLKRDSNLATHFFRLAAAQDHLAAEHSPAVMMANGKGVIRDREKALALILIAKQNTRLYINARLLLNKFQTAIKGSLNTAKISRAEWQVAALFGTHI